MQTPAPAATGSLITPCGTYLYKPDCRNSCCPNYTIRLDAASCRPRRDHRQAINAWNKFILGYGYRSKAARLCPRTREEKKWRKNHFDLQTAIHETESINIYRPIDPKTKELVGPAKEFEVHLESDSYTEEKYALFAHYQRHVHKEGPSEITKSGFKGFLCSGLGQSSRLRNGVVQKLGSYHQCYRLDGRLVAMGVLDLLPDCVSSVYLIYHPDVKDWYFGKLSALREIALAVEGGYHYYYMGFYIHSCIKMRYKNQYQPSYLLDPETYSWDPLDADYLARLSARKYVSLSVERQLHLPPHKLTGIDKLKLDEESFLRLREYQQEFGPDGSTRRGALGSRMPGLMSLEEVEDMIDLGKWTLKYGNMLLHLEDLRDWATWDIHDPSSLKRAIAELAAALGPGLVSQLVLALG
ncbi:MAG: hypothetical protein LQ343_004989 [Gyalolechia ehrenbergii]|nr:MAG: hypothetical protein LQ343_004989 [Gyalolechia ehrenbergii]